MSKKGKCSPEFTFSYWRHLVAERPADLEENTRMAPVEAAREAQLIQEAEHARDVSRPPAQQFRPAGEIVIPARLIGQQIPDQAGRRHPNSAICQIVELWRQGRI